LPSFDYCQIEKMPRCAQRQSRKSCEALSNPGCKSSESLDSYCVGILKHEVEPQVWHIQAGQFIALPDLNSGEQLGIDAKNVSMRRFCVSARYREKESLLRDAQQAILLL